MAKKTLYEILGILPDATDDEIKAAYKTLARKYHPDFNQGNAQAENAFKAIGQAYAVLSDATKRSQYDAALARERGGDRPTDTGKKKVDLVLIYFILLISLAVIFFFIDTPKGIYFLVVAIALEIRNSIEALRSELRR